MYQLRKNAATAAGKTARKRKKRDWNKLDASYIGRRMLEKNTYFSNVLSKTEFVEMPYVTLADGQRKQRLGKGIKWKFREPQIGLVQELPPVVSQSSSSSRTGETLIEVPGVVQPPRSSGAVGI